MGRGAAPAHPRRSPRASVAPSSFLTLLLLSVPWSLAENYPTYCFSNITLQLYYHVTCSRSSLDSIPPTLPSKRYTSVLDMEMNKIKVLRENSLDNFIRLQSLNLNYNEIKTVDPKTFRPCPQLKLLRLAHNFLTSLDPEVFYTNKFLHFVDLSHNKIILPNNRPFLKSPSILILKLTNTTLTEIPVQTFSEMRQLRELELENNFLTTVDVKALDFLTSKNASLYLHGNPLHCDCRLKKTWEWQYEHGAHLRDQGVTLRYREAICNEPESMRGKSWVQTRTMDCGERSANASTGTYALYAIAGLLAVVVAGALVGVGVWCFRRKRHSGLAGAGGGRRRRRLAPPVGEYIDVIPDSPPGKEPVYDSIVDPKKAFSDLVKTTDAQKPDAKGDGDTQRYVMDVFRNTYLPPVTLDSDEPLYVNMKGPPLPLRRPSDVPPPPTEPAPPAPTQGADPQPALKRPCSIPLLEGCDFYEVVD